MNEYKKALFKDGDFELEVTISPEEKTIWMTKEEIGLLLNRDRSVITRHINNIYKSDAHNEGSTCAKNAQVPNTSVQFVHKTQIIGSSQAHRPAEYFDLEIILAVSQRVKSNRGILLQQFLNDYLNKDEIDDSNIIIYNNGDINLSVNVSPEEETVWLNLDQIAELFVTSKSNVSEHIKNIFLDEELDDNRVVRNFRITASDGKSYIVKFYNLDMILAVGYRVRTKRAIEFRNWASEIIKRYLKNKEDNLSNVESNYIRLERMIFEIQDDIIDLKKKVDNSPQKEYLFLKGQFFDSYDLICSLLEKAEKEVVLTDPYFDRTGLLILSKAKKEIKKTVFISQYSKINEKDIEEYQKEYGDINVITNNDIHDRILIIDDQEFYSIGTSLNSLSKKAFMVIKIESLVVVHTLKEPLFIINK